MFKLGRLKLGGHELGSFLAFEMWTYDGDFFKQEGKKKKNSSLAICNKKDEADKTWKIFKLPEPRISYIETSKMITLNMALWQAWLYSTA